MPVTINPEVLQTYLLSVAHKTIPHARQNQNDNPNIVCMLHENYTDIIKSTTAEEKVYEEVNGISAKNVYDETDIEIMKADTSKSDKLGLLNTFKLNIIVFRQLNDGTQILNEFPLYGNNVVQGINSETRSPFKFEEYNLENLSKDIYTTKVSQKGSFKISFKDFTSLTEKVNSTIFNGPQYNPTIEFSLLNLISYAYRDNGDITFGFKMLFNDIEKLILFRPYKHTFNFYKEKIETSAPDVYYHDVTIEFTAYESSYEHDKDNNLYAKFELSELESQYELKNIYDILLFCQRIEENQKKLSNPSLSQTNINSINDEISNAKLQLQNVIRDNNKLLIQTKELQRQLDKYLFNKIIENINIWSLNTTSDKLNVYVLHHNLSESFTSKEFAVNATITVGTAVLYSALSALTAGAAVTATAAFAPIGLAILGVIAATLLFSSSEGEIRAGQTSVESNNFLNNISLIKKKGISAFAVDDKNINITQGNTTTVIETLNKAFSNTAPQSNSNPAQKIVYFYLGDLLNAARGLLKDINLEEEKFLVGNITSYYVENGKQEKYLLNIADIPVSLTLFIDYMKKVLEKTKYDISFDKLIINFFQDYLKKIYSHYFTIIAKTTNVNLNTTLFNPVLKSTYILKQGENNKQAIFNKLFTPLGYDQNKSQINLSNDIKEQTKEFSKNVRTINKSITEPEKASILKISFLGSDLQISNIDFVEIYRRSALDFNGYEFCNYVLENYNIPCITVAREKATSLAQIITKYNTDITFKRIENAHLMNSALYNGSNLLNLPYNCDLKLIPFMYFYLTNSNYIYIASPLPREPTFLFSGLYIVTSSKLSFNITKSTGGQAAALVENFNYNVELTNVWRGTNVTGGTAAEPSTTQNSIDSICDGFNEFQLVPEPSDPNIVRFRFRR